MQRKLNERGAHVQNKRGVDAGIGEASTTLGLGGALIPGSAYPDWNLSGQQPVDGQALVGADKNLAVRGDGNRKFDGESGLVASSLAGMITKK
jgi:hypothetical protein